MQCAYRVKRKGPGSPADPATGPPVRRGSSARVSGGEAGSGAGTLHMSAGARGALSLIAAGYHVS
jgi:hypothetical protein